MRYRDLKEERDAAVARALEAERLSMKSEFDRVTAEFEREKAQMTVAGVEATRIAYRNGFNAGIEAMADDVADCLKRRSTLVPPSLKQPTPSRAEVTYNEICKQRDELWALLDNIDTLDDACREDNERFRSLTYRQQRRRFAIYNPEVEKDERRGGSGEDGSGAAPEGNDRMVEVPEARDGVSEPAAAEHLVARAGGSDPRSPVELAALRQFREFERNRTKEELCATQDSTTMGSTAVKPVT
jgi:hypothetical protein